MTAIVIAGRYYNYKLRAIAIAMLYGFFLFFFSYINDVINTHKTKYGKIEIVKFKPIFIK